MGMTSQIASTEIAHEGNQLRRPVHRFNGAEPQTWQTGLAQDFPDQSCQRTVLRQIATPSAQVDAGKHQFLAACGDESTHLGQDFGSRKAARRSTRRGNDAESAAIAAALLNLEVRTRLEARHYLSILDVGVGEAVVCPYLSGRADGQQTCRRNQR
jgi:hypothetical protein